MNRHIWIPQLYRINISKKSFRGRPSFDSSKRLKGAERLLEQEEDQGDGLEIDGGSGSDEGVRTVKSRKSVARSVLTTGTGATMATKYTVASNGTVLREKKAWVPAEHHERIEEKRVRKKRNHTARKQLTNGTSWPPRKQPTKSIKKERLAEKSTRSYACCMKRRIGTTTISSSWKV